jgi:hypothetical protein
MRPATVIAINVLVTCAAIAAYHLAFDRGGAAPPLNVAPPVPQEPASRPLDPIGVAPSFARFEALERRMAVLERALSAGIAKPAPDEEKPAGVQFTGASAVWTEEQLAALAAMIAEIETRKRQEQYGAMMRDALRKIGKGSLTSDQEERAVALLVAFQRKVWELFPGGTAGTTQAERDATNASAMKARAALEEELRGILPVAVAEGIMARVQQFPGKFPPDLVPKPPAEGK